MSPTGRNALNESRSAKIWSSGLSEDMNMNSSGKAKNPTSKMRTTYPPARRSPGRRSSRWQGPRGSGPGPDRGWSWSSPLTGEVALHERDGQHQHEEHQRDRRGEGGLLLAVADPDRLEDHRRGPVKRAALGHDVDLGEQAERGDGDGDQDEGPGRFQPWPGDIAELLPLIGAVQLGGLVQLPRDGLQ